MTGILAMVTKRQCGRCGKSLPPRYKVCRHCGMRTAFMPAVVPEADPFVAQVKRVATIEAREAKAKAMLEAWTRKRDRAETKVKKYQRKVTYYENRRAGGAVDAQEESES